MKKSKIFWLVALMVMNAVAVRAQECPIKQGERVHFRAEEKMERLSQALDLTPEQRTEMQKLMNQKAERMTAQKTAAEAEREQFRKILTPEQYAKWEQMKEQRGAMKPGEHRRGHGPRRGPVSGDCPKECCKKSDACKGECPKAVAAPTTGKRGPKDR